MGPILLEIHLTNELSLEQECTCSSTGKMLLSEKEEQNCIWNLGALQETKWRGGESMGFGFKEAEFASQLCSLRAE